MKQGREIQRMMRDARLRAGLTQAELAKLMRTAQSTIARLECGGRSPSYMTLEKWAEVTGHQLEVQMVRMSLRDI